MPATPLPGAGRAVVVINPRSGGGKAGRYGLADACAARGIEAIVLGAGDDVAGIAADAVNGGATAIGAAGGDGTQGTVAAVAAAHDVPFVCVPIGTRNHFALDLGADPRNPVAALDAFSSGHERRVDLGRVNNRMFVNNVSLGWYGELVDTDAYRDAKIKTALEMLPDLISPDAAPFDLRFGLPSGEECLSAYLLLVSNNPYQLIRPPRQGARRGLDQGTLGVIALPDRARAGRRAVLNWTAPSFDVQSADTVHVGLDGEAVALDPPLRFTTVPGALRVLSAAKRRRRPLRTA